MKKSILLLVPVLFLFQSVCAQDDNLFQKNSTTFGFKLGLDETFVWNSSKTVNRLGYYGGLFAETRLSRKFGLQYEIRYSRYNDAGENVLNFIEIPVVAKYYFNDKVNIFLGPRLDFLVDSSDGHNNFTPAVEVGVQYNFSRSFFMEAAYSISSESQIYSDGNNGGTRTNLRLGLGFKL